MSTRQPRLPRNTPASRRNVRSSQYDMTSLPCRTSDRENLPPASRKHQCAGHADQAVSSRPARQRPITVNPSKHSQARKQYPPSPKKPACLPTIQSLNSPPARFTQLGQRHVEEDLDQQPHRASICHAARGQTVHDTVPASAKRKKICHGSMVQARSVWE